RRAPWCGASGAGCRRLGSGASGDLRGGDDGADDRGERPAAVGGAPAADQLNGVAVLEPPAGAAVGEGDGLVAGAGSFDERALLAGIGARDGAGGEQVATAEAGTVGGEVA